MPVSFRGCDTRGGLFFIIKPRQNAACLDGAGIGGNIDLRRLVDEIQVALLSGKHRDIFEEGCLYLLEYLVGRFRILNIEIVCLAPEIVRCSLRLRGYRI
jgi:hypothetical protein